MKTNINTKGMGLYELDVVLNLLTQLNNSHNTYNDLMSGFYDNILTKDEIKQSKSTVKDKMITFIDGILMHLKNEEDIKYWDNFRVELLNGAE